VNVVTEQNKLVVRRFLEEIVNTGDVDRLGEFIAADCNESNDSTGRSVGLESMRARVPGVRQAYADLQITIEQQIAEGEWVATRITAQGTHLGEWLGIAPTNRPVTITGVNLDRVLDGTIVEHGGAANMLETLRLDPHWDPIRNHPRFKALLAEADVLRHHGMRSPMIDGHSADGAPPHVRALETIHEAHHIVCSAGRLPVVELLGSHGRRLPDGRIDGHPAKSARVRIE
jgi:predicted ester cyclase